MFHPTPSQNTAPVLEFNCLYTHDVKKKQKKWQDGFLRYHTFNKRVMVYDVPRNYIGDMHWTGSHAIQEGDELALERVGSIVEVGDRIGETETDITELRKSRNIKHAPSTAAVSSVAATRSVGSMLTKAKTQVKHRSLSALLGTPNSQTLRLTSGRSKKRTLLCQDQLAKKPKRLSSINTDAAADALLDQVDDTGSERKASLSKKQLEAPSRANAIQAKPPAQDKAVGLGPWSREAFDLFTWRPPDWDEENWRKEENEKDP